MPAQLVQIAAPDLVDQVYRAQLDGEAHCTRAGEALGMRLAERLSVQSASGDSA